jgi:glycerate kinase
MNDVRAEVLKAWKSVWDNYVKTLTAMHDQGEKMLDVFCTQSDTVHAETKKLLSESMKNVRDAQMAYIKAVEDNLAKFGETVGQKKE